MKIFCSFSPFQKFSFLTQNSFQISLEFFKSDNSMILVIEIRFKSFVFFIKFLGIHEIGFTSGRHINVTLFDEIIELKHSTNIENYSKFVR